MGGGPEPGVVKKKVELYACAFGCRTEAGQSPHEWPNPYKGWFRNSPAAVRVNSVKQARLFEFLSAKPLGNWEVKVDLLEHEEAFSVKRPDPPREAYNYGRGEI